VDSSGRCCPEREAKKVDRKVFDTVPPQVEYRLSELGQSLSQVLKGLADWAQNNSKTILLSRSTYDAKNGE